MAQGKKTLYHGEFCQLGPTRVVVKSDIMKSKYAGKPNYIALLINNAERTYNVENANCENFWRGHNGQTFTVRAFGDRESAGFECLTDNAAPNQPPPNNYPPPNNQPPPPQSHSAPPPQSQQPPPRTNRNPPPPNPAANPATALDLVKRQVAKKFTLAKLTLKGMMMLDEDYKSVKGVNMPEPLFQSVLCSMLIDNLRGCTIDGLPNNYDFKSGQMRQQAPPPATTQQQQPSPQQQQQTPPPTAAQYSQPAQPPEDDVPF